MLLGGDWPRATRQPVDEAVDKLSGRLDRLAKALDEQLDKSARGQRAGSEASSKE
jgi:hypothetical protein